jgi:DNA-binding winged helix-turn-helix (wHTH) protein
MPRYRFSHFILSPRQRLLVCGGRERPLIPRYFDLLVFLIERRHEAVHRREIFDRVWSDVIVSESALSQAIRTIRRTLDDDPREPRFIRTVSRHGYRFVFPEVIEEEDNGTWPPDTPAIGADTPPPQAAALPAPAAAPVDPYEPLIERLTREDGGDEDEQREAAELLHRLGTAEALRRLGTRPRHAMARALLRDTRWDTAEAGDVPLMGEPGGLAAAAALVHLRLRRAARIAAARWAASALGGGMAGLAGGAIGGLIVAAAPGSAAPLALSAVLAAIGAVCGAIGGAGVGAGLSIAETTARSRRFGALVSGAALGGGLVGFAVQLLARWSLEALVGLRVDVGGALEGLLIGGAAGLGYAFGAPAADGLAAPRGARRARAVALVALACGLAALTITLIGRPLVGGTIHRIAEMSGGAQATLTPFGRLVGEPDFGPISGALIGTGEGALFGIGLAVGLTRRPSRLQ